MSSSPINLTSPLAGSRRCTPCPPTCIVGLHLGGAPPIDRLGHPDRWVPLSVSADLLVREITAAHLERAKDPQLTLTPKHDRLGLTSRGAEILTLMCAGHTNQEIAGLIFLSVNSIKTHIRTLYRKLGVNRRSQAVAWGLDLGY